VLRAPADLVERAEKLRERLERQSGLRVAISEVYRQALERGLRALERRAERS
jgi:hypothetical protein